MTSFVWLFLICFAFAIFMGWNLRYSSASYEFEVWMPTSKQVEMVKMRNEYRSLWLGIGEELTKAKAKGVNPITIERMASDREKAEEGMRRWDEKIDIEKQMLYDRSVFEKMSRRLWDLTKREQ